MVAAALLGEGMSSPLMDQLRERRGLVYYAACSADVLELCGQFVIEASTSPEQLDEFFVQVMRLLRAHAERIDALALERARNQIAVRDLRARAAGAPAGGRGAGPVRAGPRAPARRTGGRPSMRCRRRRCARPSRRC